MPNQTARLSTRPTTAAVMAKSTDLRSRTLRQLLQTVQCHFKNLPEKMGLGGFARDRDKSTQKDIFHPTALTHFYSF